MRILRIAYTLGLLGLAGWPLLQPFRGWLQPETWAWTAGDLARIAHLASNTLKLVAGTLLVALPAGAALALILLRVRWRAARFLAAATLLLLFVPLPIVLSCWQALLGHDGVMPTSFWLALDGRPWASGLGPSVWIHTVAAIPWVVAIVGLGLLRVESELEEEAALQTSPWRVFTRITLPRVRPSLVAAAVFVAFTTMNEITVTDMMQFATLAEEMHTQFTLGEREPLSRTLLVAFPFYVAAWLVLLAATWRWESRMPPLLLWSTPPRRFDLAERWGWQPLVIATFALLLLPLGSLLWKVGLRGFPPMWSWQEASTRLLGEGRLYGLAVCTSVLTSLTTGLLIAGLALLGAWLALGSRLFRLGMWALLTFAWIMPGPLVGIGLQETILQMVQALPEGAWTTLLYRGPSPAPLMWAHVVRFLPFAVFAMWPVVRSLPKELRETARLEGARAWRLLWPWCRPAFGLTALAASALSLGEVAASTRVETPRWEAFAKLLFDRMHYGVEASVAALGLLMLGALGLVGFGVAIGRWIMLKSK